MRTASFAMLFVAISLEIAGEADRFSIWILLGFVFLIYPHVQLFRAYKAKNPVSAEMRNLIVDSVLLGMPSQRLGFQSGSHFPELLVYCPTM